jgi:hypothetical protein
MPFGAIAIAYGYKLGQTLPAMTMSMEQNANIAIPFADFI